jgi:hypothetical protein
MPRLRFSIRSRQRQPKDAQFAHSVVFGGVGVAFAQQPGAGALTMAVIFSESCVGYFTMDSRFPRRTVQFCPTNLVKWSNLFLPQPVVAGDVLMVHADGTPTDLIRFPDDGGDMTTRMLYYSDPEPSEPNAPTQARESPRACEDPSAIPARR